MKFLSTWLRNPSVEHQKPSSRQRSSMKFLSTWLRNLDKAEDEGVDPTIPQ